MQAVRGVSWAQGGPSGSLQVDDTCTFAIIPVIALYWCVCQWILFLLCSSWPTLKSGGDESVDRCEIWKWVDGKYKIVTFHVVLWMDLNEKITMSWKEYWKGREMRRMTSDWTNFEGNSKYIKKYRIMFTVVYPMVIWPQLVLKRWKKRNKKWFRGTTFTFQKQKSFVPCVVPTPILEKGSGQ